MKFTDIKTLEHLLKEYGASSGKPSYGSNYSPSRYVKPTSNITKPSRSPSVKPSKSPTMTGGSAKQTDDMPQQVMRPAKELEVGQEIKDNTGKVVGVVKSVVGDQDKPEAMVVQDPRNKQMDVVDADKVLTITNPDLPVEENSKVSKLLSKKKKKHHLHRKIKRLIRKDKLREQDEPLFEINFNNREIVKKALDLPVKCGFEAETAWLNVSGGSDDEDWMYEYNWYDLEDMLYDQEGRSAVDSVTESYDEYINELALEYEGDVIADMVANRKEDEDYINEFVENNLSESEIEDYKEERLEGMDDDQKEEYEDWDFMAWGRELVEEQYDDELEEYLAEDIRDNGEAYDEARDMAERDHDIDDWARDEYGSWSSLLSDFGYYLSNPDGGGGVDEVANEVYDWVNDNSAFKDIESGEYHSGYGANQTNWRVETDSSIEADYGTGAEIISPVYETPRKMMEEMKSLFKWLETRDVETNSSTGLHVTMSYNVEPYGQDVNSTKLAILLGDKYLLSTFGRESNSYARSQYDNLLKAAERLKANPEDITNIKKVEDILSRGLSQNKFSSIHFKDDKDRETQNQLIEFRIGGGDDYHTQFDTVAKAVVRFATTLHSAYDPELFKAEYIKALYRLINQVGKIKPRDEERYAELKKEYKIDDPVMDVLKDFYSNDNYLEFVRKVASAFDDLAQYKSLSQPDAVKKWKQSVKDYEKGTGDKLEIVEDEPIRGYIQPDKTSPRIRAVEFLDRAQEKISYAIAQAGYDLSTNQNRRPVNAKSIGVLRSILTKFEMSYEDLDAKIKKVLDQVIFRGGDEEYEPRVKKIKNGVDRLFKKDVITPPEFLSYSKTEKLFNKLWNAVNTEDFMKDKRLFKLYGELLDQSADSVLDNFNSAMNDSYYSRNFRQKKDFYSWITNRGPRGIQIIPGNPVNSKAYDRLVKYLDKYPVWDQPVSRTHNPDFADDDSYQDNWLSDFMQQYRRRWDEIQRIKNSNTTLYVDMVRQVIKDVKQLVKVVGVSQEDSRTEWDDRDPSLENTPHQSMTDGPSYFGLSDYSKEDFLDTIVRVESEISDNYQNADVEGLKSRLQEFFRSTFDAYYKEKNREPEFYKLGIIPSIIKPRLVAIKKFMNQFDNVTQKLGFDNQDSNISNKLKLDKKAQKFDKKHGVDYVIEIPKFSGFGRIWVKKSYLEDLSQYDFRQIHNNFGFDDAPFQDVGGDNRPRQAFHRNNFDTILRIPDAHYFIALEANEIIEDRKYDRTWRKDKALMIKRLWEQTYNVTFENLKDEFTLMDKEIQKKLATRKIKFNDELGDGREGVGEYEFDPLLPREELQGPYGEPFERSAAAGWHVNNPELSKKIKNRDKENEFVADNNLALAAGVEDMANDSSNGIASSTNWGNLADYLKIERGVNDQGVNLLKKVYDQYDGDHNWRPEPDPTACCLPRWAAAVRAANDYIKKSYNVSGGNYFRKNADGSDGDDVSSLYKKQQDDDSGFDVTTDDYEAMRNRYGMFNAMMADGIQNYILQPDVNSLVGFLKNEQNDESFKQAVLNSMVKEKQAGEEPNDFQGHLARARRRMQQEESVFAKFDALPLEEKLEIMSKSDILEKWSKKYKSSIDCNNPKGFSQKAHCAGKKKKKANENHGKYYCSTDKKWKYRKGPKQKRKTSESQNLKRGNCYQDSIKVLRDLLKMGMRPEELKLAHGIVTGAMPGSATHDKCFGHAWVEVKDVFVFDPSGNQLMKDRYYQVGRINPKDVKLYTPQEMNNWMMKSKHYGPWEVEPTDFEKSFEGYYKDQLTKDQEDKRLGLGKYKQPPVTKTPARPTRPAGPGPKPYLFIDPQTGRVSGNVSSDLNGMSFSKFPFDNPNLMKSKYGFGRAVNGAYFMNKERLEKLVLGESVISEKALGRNDLYTDDRRQAFALKLKTNDDFTLAGGDGVVKLDSNMADAFIDAEDYTQLPAKLTTADGETITYSKLEKTSDFGARGGQTLDASNAKVSNKGEVAEGVLGCGTFARLIKRPSAEINYSDILDVIKKLPKDAPDQGGWHELTLSVTEIDSPISDKFTLTINLKSDTYADFIDPQKWGTMKQIAMGVEEYVNVNLKRYTDYFQANGKVDEVGVVADGVSGETDTKVDVFMTHNGKTLQHYDMSVKVGSTKQMGQVGGGAQKETMETKYQILRELWERFGADLSTIEGEFLNAEDIDAGYRIAYEEAQKQISVQLAGTREDDEKKYMAKLIETIKFFATLNDDRVKLVQFKDLKAGGFYVLDFKKLNRLYDQDKFDLEVKMKEGVKNPVVTFYNKVNGQDFLSIRMYKASSGYIRNYIEKEKELVNVTTVRKSGGMRKKVESIQENAVPDNHTVRKLRELFASPLKAGDIKAQMNAYVCIPDPSMIRDFRFARAQSGDDFDMRSILMNYAKAKLHPEILRKLK